MLVHLFIENFKMAKEILAKMKYYHNIQDTIEDQLMSLTVN